MKILALEFSSAQRSVAVLDAAEKVESDRSDRSGRSDMSFIAELIEAGHLSTRPLAMIEEVLRQAHTEREQIESLAIGLGPGSYTGVRTAIALAQGWELASPPASLKTLGISSADAMAAQAQADGLRGAIAIAIDAQRGEFYLAQYELGYAGWRSTSPLHLASLAEVRQCEAEGYRLISPDAGQWFPSAQPLFPRAAAVARLAARRSDFLPAETLEPIYLRQTAFVKAPRPRF